MAIFSIFVKKQNQLTTTESLLEERTSENYKAVIGNKKLIAIDEAQKISDIGLKLKLIVDTIPDLMVIATGSSAFDLTNKLGEPLTGRNYYTRSTASW